MNELKIIITGPTASGKSTIAWKLKDFLSKEGFNVLVVDLDEDVCPDTNDCRFVALLDKITRIEISTVNSNTRPEHENS